MIVYFGLALFRYTTFTGRSRRSEYWYFTLMCALLNLLLTILSIVVDQSIVAGAITLLLSLLNLVLFISAIAVATRRLHDVGRSGWWQLIAITIIGGLLLLYWYMQDSEAGTNQYGPNPKLPAMHDLTRHLVE